MFDRIKTGQYWDQALTLVEGCTPVSPGCDNCWSAAMHHRFITDNLTDPKGKFRGIIRLREDRLALPLKVRKPTVWCVWNDLFHEDVPDKFIAAVLWTMAMCPHHIFIILPKGRILDGREWLEVPNVKSND